MPRLNSGQEVFKELTSLSVFRIVASTPGDTTTSGSTAQGASVVAVTASTNFTNGDPVATIGDGGAELNQINGTVATSMPVKWKTQFAFSAGARFVEMVESPLGHISQDGVSLQAQRDLASIISAMARAPIASIPSGVAQMSVKFNLLGYNNQNLQMAFGQTESEQGTGTAADPHQSGIGLTSIGSQGFQCLRLIGTRNDLKSVYLDFCDATVEVGVDLTLGSTPPAVIPVTLRFTNLVQRIFT